MSDFTELAIAGRIATPADADWDEARLAWNLAADQRPSAVAFAESAEDVARTVGFAAAQRPQGRRPGHRPRRRRACRSLEGTILIKTERMRGVEVDPDARRRGSRRVCSRSSWARPPTSTASVDAGLLARRRRGRLHARRRAELAGRKHGFACNRVRAIELVTADGEQRTVDAENDADLFWALRGGGGGYAIVTALHLDLLPIAEIYAGALLFPAEVGADAVRAYRDWAASAPDEVTSVVRFLTPPPIPDVPEPIRGVPLLTIDGACIGTKEEGEAAFAPLRELGEPIMDTFEWMPARGPQPDPHGPREPGPRGRRRRPGQGAERRGDRRLRRRRRPRLGLAAAAQRAAPPRRRARAAGRGRRRPHPPRRRLRHVQRRDADDARRWARRSPATWPRSTRRCGPGPPTAATSTSPRRPATSTRSCRRTSATDSAR